MRSCHAYASCSSKLTADDHRAAAEELLGFLLVQPEFVSEICPHSILVGIDAITWPLNKI